MLLADCERFFSFPESVTMCRPYSLNVVDWKFNALTPRKEGVMAASLFYLVLLAIRTVLGSCTSTLAEQGDRGDTARGLNKIADTLSAK
jgi:hypothetical protein